MSSPAFTRNEMLRGTAGAATIALLGATSNSDDRVAAFTGCRLIDGNGEAPIEHAAILVRNGTIVAVGAAADVSIPSEAQHVHLSGKTVMPALIDAHVHVGIVEGTTADPDKYGPAPIEANLAKFRSYGLAAVLVMGTDRTPLGVAQRDASLRRRDATIMETAGTGLGVPGGFPPAQMIGAPWLSRPSTPEEARNAVRKLADLSPDVVKLWVDSGFGKYPTMDRAISAAIIDEAHRHGLRAAAHLFYLEDARALVEQGLDIVAHSVRDREIDSAFLAELRWRDVSYITTLTLDESQYIYADDSPAAYVHDPAFVAALEPGVGAMLASPEYKRKKQHDPDTPKWYVAAEISKHNALRVQRAGVRIAVGTDAGATFERIRGFDTHRELELLVRSGLTPLEAIRCGTVAAAQVLGPRAAALGALETGKQANFLVLEDDPSVDITSTRRMESIYLGGVSVPTWRDV